MFERGDLVYINFVDTRFTNIIRIKYCGLGEVVQLLNQFGTMEVQILNGNQYHGTICLIHKAHIHKLNHS